MAGVRKRIPNSRPGGSHLLLTNRTVNPPKKRFKLEARHLVFLVVGLGVGFGVMSVINSIWMSSRVYTPFERQEDDLVKYDMSKFWGTYRPQVYMGMKTKSPQSLVTGLMWLQQYENYRTDLPLRHTCEQGDKLLRYGWLAHDGGRFGIQDIVERDFVLRTEFVKRDGGDNGGDWTWRITGRSQNDGNPIALSLFFYAATDGQGSIASVISEGKNGKQLTEIQGETMELGKFVIKFPSELSGKQGLYHTVTAKSEGLHKIKDTALRKMQATKAKRKNQDKLFYFLGDTPNRSDPPNTKSDVIFYQVTFELPFEIEIVFESTSFQNRRDTLAGPKFTSLLASIKDKFDKKFEKKFPLKDKGYGPEEIQFAKAALSNMLGGIGHFYGHSLVQSEYQNNPVKYWDSHLLTAVPSRSFFPRGFLWDEGFHQLLVSKWDRSLSEEIIQSWLGMVNIEGWIPREQILGDEARSKVPSEFVVQHNTNANPPTLFLAIESIIEAFNVDTITKKDREFLKKIYPRLKAWYNWFNTTQAGKQPFTYRWRGRTADSDTELNPKTLTSGLDDYPRASHPSDDERHVDLRCWMAFASDTMAKIAVVVHPEIPAEAEKYAATHRLLTDNELLKELHWSSDMGLFSDYGNHTDRVFLVRRTFQNPQPGQPPTTRTVRVEKQTPKLQFVNSYGYVSLFPFLLQILEPDSDQLNQILQDMRGDDNLLWTHYGLRSLSKRDSMYMKRNTEHDPPYWRGQIWININFLAVRALKHYSTVDGPFAGQAQELYKALRKNLVQNLFEQYSKTGYLWENYNDINGKGQGSHPFTGWSALVVLIMSEQY
uniref:Mannosyl-oligosaccharide glucosidase n=1 Tax=Phallusia mammillata TaxID=59560 RepID=A0A6F9DL87_9ASCI|nr:mannosyl-oligosaccharide glucosidase-like [Phallusia mammillata]